MCVKVMGPPQIVKKWIGSIFVGTITVSFQIFHFHMASFFSTTKANKIQNSFRGKLKIQRS